MRWIASPNVSKPLVAPSHHLGLEMRYRGGRRGRGVNQWGRAGDWVSCVAKGDGDVPNSSMIEEAARNAGCVSAWTTTRQS